MMETLMEIERKRKEMNSTDILNSRDKIMFEGDFTDRNKDSHRRELTLYKSSSKDLK